MNYVKKLPDAYDKRHSSNAYKLLDINKQGVDELHEGIAYVDTMLDLNKADGSTLDMYGKLVSQPRGDMTDDQYRYMIFAKIGRMANGGDYNSVVNMITTILRNGDKSTSPSQVLLEDADTSGVVRVVSIPLAPMLKAGLTAEMIIDIIENMLPIGVKLDESSIMFSGTFELSAAYERDDEAGFGTVDQAIGGFFGYLGG